MKNQTSWWQMYAKTRVSIFPFICYCWILFISIFHHSLPLMVVRRAFIYLFRANTHSNKERVSSYACMCVCLLVCYPFGCLLMNCLIVVAVDAAVVVVSMSVNIHHRLCILHLNIMDHMKMTYMTQSMCFVRYPSCCYPIFLFNLFNNFQLPAFIYCFWRLNSIQGERFTIFTRG